MNLSNLSGRGPLAVCLFLSALACDPGGPTFEVSEATSALSASERRDRAGRIRELYAAQGITSAWLAAGLADAETMMTYCRNGETPFWERNGCSGRLEDPVDAIRRNAKRTKWQAVLSLDPIVWWTLLIVGVAVGLTLALR